MFREEKLSGQTMKIIASLVAVAVLAFAPAARGQQPPAAYAAAADRAFLEMMTRPGDPDAAVRYARLAAARGDARAAIAALERVLRMSPALDNIRLEIASLYLASGSPDLAALYARQALDSPDIPPLAAERAREILAQAERGASRWLLDGSLFIGARWDSNANGVTPLGTVPIFAPAVGGFLPAQLPASGQPSWSSVIGGRLQHRYDLELQREGSWETNGALYDQRFASIPRAYDLGIVALDTGPRIGVAELDEGIRLALRPFATLGWLGYADSTYAWLYGGGLTAELRLATRWTLELTGLARFGNYLNSQFRPTARDYTCWETVITAGVSYQVSERTQVTASVTYVNADARQPYFARQGVGGQLAVQSLLRLGAWDVRATARAAVRGLDYDAPDPFINPFVRRRDTRWEAGAAVFVPLTRRVAAVLEYDYFNQRSNYELYRFDSQAVTFGLRAAF
jgi:tetratricopeptide (TPR) repeat protein